MVVAMLAAASLVATSTAMAGKVKPGKAGMIYGAGNAAPIGIVGDFFDINASNGVIHVIDTVLLP